MKNQIKLLIGMIIIILGIIMTVIAFAMSTVVNKDSILKKNKETIINGYTQLTINTGDNVDIRQEIENKLSTFSNETYPEEHDAYIELLNEYNANTNKIIGNVNEIGPKCEDEYDDARVNIMCTGYGMIHEEVMNIYVKILTDYNNKITSYNETAEEDYETFEMIQTEYIDVNQDGIYKGQAE